jgi:hypothetical protein
MAPRIALGFRHIANTPKHLVIAMISVFFGCSAAYALIESKGPIESVWWAIVTASTVGYGDQYPETSAGRFVGAILIISFVVFVVLSGSQLTANLVADPHLFSDDEQKEMQARLVRIEEKLDHLIEHGLRNMVVINSVSDLSNDELRKLLEVQRGFAPSVRS